MRKSGGRYAIPYTDMPSRFNHSIYFYCYGSESRKIRVYLHRTYILETQIDTIQVNIYILRFWKIKTIDKMCIIQRKWPGGIVRKTYVLKSKKAAMQISANRPFQMKEMACAKALRQE